VDLLQSEIKVNLGPHVNFFNGRNEKIHVGTWVAIQKSLCRKMPRPAMSLRRKYIINQNDMKVILNVVY